MSQGPLHECKSDATWPARPASGRRMCCFVPCAGASPVLAVCREARVVGRAGRLLRLPSGSQAGRQGAKPGNCPAQRHGSRSAGGAQGWRRRATAGQQKKKSIVWAAWPRARARDVAGRVCIWPRIRASRLDVRQRLSSLARRVRRGPARLWRARSRRRRNRAGCASHLAAPGGGGSACARRRHDGRGWCVTARGRGRRRRRRRGREDERTSVVETRGGAIAKASSPSGRQGRAGLDGAATVRSGHIRRRRRSRLSSGT